MTFNRRIRTVLALLLDRQLKDDGRKERGLTILTKG